MLEALFLLYEIVRPWLYWIFILMICRWIYQGISWIVGFRTLRGVIKKKQAEREAGFRKLEGQERFQLNGKHEKILALSDEQLIEQLQTRKLKAVEVLEAFIAKALKVTRDLNAITEFIPQAEEWARELDDMKEVKGPFHGLPISVKDNCWVKGMDSSIGLAKFLYKPMAKDAVIVQSFKDLGCVPFCRTNVPQTLLSFACGNPIFGVTKNCVNPDLSSGGSSGGEASLVGAGGSRLGIGSDIGGSVRIPAHFCGIAAFKATSQRISGTGFRGSLPNVVGVYGVPGLMAQDTKMLVKATKHILEDGKQNKYDPIALPIPWNEQIFSSKRKLRIGYYTSLPYFPLIGDTEEITLNAKRALESLGHELVPFEMPDSFAIMDMVFDFIFADKGMHLLENWQCEPMLPSVIVNFLVCKAPNWLRTLVVAMMTNPKFSMVYSPRGASIPRAGVDKTGFLWRKLGERKAMIEQVTTQWKNQGLDLLLTPTFPFPAVEHNMPGRLQPSVLYTMIFNLFDFPCGVIKFGKESLTKIDAYNPQGDVVLKTAKKAIRLSKDMPISVQLVGLPYQEELVLRGMMELETKAPKF